MALSIKEQLDILTGVVTPNDSSYTLTNLTEQVAINEAQDIIGNIKSVNKETHLDAYKYKEKILNFCSNLLFGAVRIELLNKLLIAIYADTGIYSNVTSATTAQWTTFLENNILKVIENFSRILSEEKIEYDTL